MAMMSRKLKIHWITWSILTLLVMIGTIAFFLSTSSVSVPLSLNPSTAISVSVYRLLSDTLRFSLQFKGTGQPRPELGSYRVWRETGFTGYHLEFPEPGEPIKILVRGAGKEIVYQALPADSYGPTLGREFTPVSLGDTPKHLRWPPDNALRPILSSGNTTLRFSVIEVGRQIEGEQVILRIDPPLGFLSAMPGYGFLWWFFLWPFYMPIIIAYGGILLWKTKRAGPAKAAVAS